MMVPIGRQSLWLLLFLLFLTACSSAGSDLKGSRWSLTAYGPATAPISPVPGSRISLEFESGRELGGFGGCNGFGGRYRTWGSSITVSNLFTTLVACFPDSVMRQEQAFTDALTAVTDYTVTATELRLNYPGGALLFAPAVPLVQYPLQGTDWVLTTVEEGTIAHSIVAGSPITAQFDATHMRGSAGCNSYGAAYLIEGEAIEVVEIETTTMACDEQRIMAQEAEFISALQLAETITITGDRLLIRGQQWALHFTAVPKE